MSEYNGEDNNHDSGSYRNNHNPNYRREASSGYGRDPYSDGRRPRRRGGQAWLTATLVLVAFLAGAMLMRYLPPGSPGIAPGAEATTSAAADETAAPVAAATDPESSPQATLPALGGSAEALLGQGADIPAIARAIGPAVVGVTNKASGFSWNSQGGEVEQGTGSGVIISADGYIVTNNHVIAGADSVSVTLPGGKEVDARIVGADEQTDLAVLKIDGSGLTAAPIGDSDQMQVGQTVIAIGNPLGEELAGTVTMGILSARDREMVVDGYRFKLFQTDAAINPGNSGGALVNMAGELIGINNLKSVSAGTDEYGMPISAEGIGFAIPINSAMPIVEQLITDGYIPRPMLGIDSSLEINEWTAQRNRVPQGIYLRSLTRGGPADKAGLQDGDILTEIDGTAVTTLVDMNTVLTQHSIGDTVKVKVWRDGSDMTFDVTLEGKQK